MNGFYICIIFIGISIEFIAGIWILIDKKNQIDYRKTIDQKKENLVEIIEDADIMVEELNKFSDYIVTEFDSCEKKLEKYLDRVDRICAQSNIDENIIMENGVKNGTDNMIISSQINLDQLTKNKRNDTYINSVARVNMNKTQMNMNSFKKNNNDNVIHLNSKYRKVLNLSENGISQIDIAKSLNLGKGEVKLIIDKYQR